MIEEKTQTAEDIIGEILESQKSTIKATLTEALKKQIMEHLSWSLREKISEITSKFVQEEMTEDIKLVLAEQKAVILASLKDAFIKIGAKVAEAMVVQATKNLEVNSYNTREILKKLID